MDFFFPVDPVAVQSARFCRHGKFIRSYQPESVVSFKKAIKTLAMKQLPPDFKIFETGIKVEIDFIFPPLKSFSKKKMQSLISGEIIYKTTRPDLSDNLHKAFMDALTGTLWEDDGLIAENHSRKIYGVSGGIRLKVLPLTNIE